MEQGAMEYPLRPLLPSLQGATILDHARFYKTVAPE